VTSCGLGRPSSGQNNYKNLNAHIYNVLFVSVMGSHLQSYRMPVVVVLSMYTRTPGANTLQRIYITSLSNLWWLSPKKKYLTYYIEVNVSLIRHDATCKQHPANRPSNISRNPIHHTNKQIKVPRNTILPNQSSFILNNNKHSNSVNMNWSPTSSGPTHPNRTNSNNTILHILHSKPDNNKTMRQNNRLIVKKL